MFISYLYCVHVYTLLINVVYPQKYPLPEVLCGSYLLTDYRPDLITMVLDKLVPETMRYDLEWTGNPFYFHNHQCVWDSKSFPCLNFYKYILLIKSKGLGKSTYNFLVPFDKISWTCIISFSRIGVIAKKFADVVDKKEEWYGTEYKLEDIPEEKIQVSI